LALKGLTIHQDGNLSIITLFNFTCNNFVSEIYQEILDEEFDRFDRSLKINPQLLNNLRDSYNVNLLMKAIEDGERDLFMKLLLNCPQDISIVDNYGMNSFHHAAYSQDKEWFEELKKKVLQEGELERLLNSGTNCGYTSLHCAVISGDNESIRWLLQNGADARISDKCKMLAGEYGDETAKQIICEYYAHEM